MATSIDFIDPRVVQNLEICSHSVSVFCTWERTSSAGLLSPKSAAARHTFRHGRRVQFRRMALREEGANDHDQDYHADQNPIHLDGDGRDAECGGEAGQEVFFSE